MTYNETTTIQFDTPCNGPRFEGVVIHDYGHEVKVQITRIDGKTTDTRDFIGSFVTFPKSEMLNCFTRENSCSSHTLKLSEILGA